jgi:hypothetical protein
LSEKAVELKASRQKPPKPYVPSSTSFLDKDGNVVEGFDSFLDVFDPETFMIDIAGIISTLATSLANIVEVIVIYTTVVSFLGALVVGIYSHVICGFTEFGSGLDSSVQTAMVLAQCSWDKFTKFFSGNCTRYYLTDMVFGLLYGVLIELPIVIIYAVLGLDLQPVVDLVYEVAVIPLDEIIFAISGYHIIMWSPDVVQECYRCVGTYRVAGQEFTFSKPFNEWAAAFKCSGKQMAQGITKVVQSIIPSPKWGAWIEAKHLDGADNNPSWW